MKLISTIDYNAAAALAAVAAALAAVIALILEGRRSRFALGVDLIMRLVDQFDSAEFRKRRMKAAKAIKEKTFEDADDVFDFFETIGMFTRRGALDKKVVWSTYAHWVYHYWHAAASDYIKIERKKSPTTWQDFEYLYKVILAVDQRESRVGSLPTIPKKDDIAAFLSDEECLDA